MGGLTTFDAAYIAMIFFVPGYVYYAVRGHLVAGHRTRGNEALVRLLCMSCVTFLATGWLTYPIVMDPTSTSWQKSLTWLCSILITPAILGVISGIATQKGWMKRFYESMRLKPVHVVPTAWDFAFASMHTSYVIVTLHHGGRFAGIWGNKSFASDEPSERDIFLERVFEIGEDNGEWTDARRSVLIRSTEIRHIEFID